MHRGVSRGVPSDGTHVWWNREVGNQHTGRFSGTVLDGGSVGNPNPRPPLDEVGAMRIAGGYTVSKLNLQLDLGLDARLYWDVADNQLHTEAKSKYEIEANGYQTHVGVAARAV